MFYVFSLDDGSGYAIDAIWPHAEILRLPEVHKTLENAAEWLHQNSEAYIEASVAARPTNVIHSGGLETANSALALYRGVAQAEQNREGSGVNRNGHRT